jgi:hypothetical protein
MATVWKTTWLAVVASKVVSAKVPNRVAVVPWTSSWVQNDWPGDRSFEGRLEDRHGGVGDDPRRDLDDEQARPFGERATREFDDRHERSRQRELIVAVDERGSGRPSRSFATNNAIKATTLAKLRWRRSSKRSPCPRRARAAT